MNTTSLRKWRHPKLQWQQHTKFREREHNDPNEIAENVAVVKICLLFFFFFFAYLSAHFEVFKSASDMSEVENRRRGNGVAMSTAKMEKCMKKC